MIINLLVRMQKIQQIPEKGLFTFYKQQQDLYVSNGISEIEQHKTPNTQGLVRKKVKKKQKNNTEMTQKASFQKQGNNEFQTIKEQSHKKQKTHKKVSKLHKKKPAENETLHNLKPQQNKKQQFLSIINTYSSTNRQVLNKDISSTSMILKLQERDKIFDINKNISLSNKKIIVSEANLAIKPFQKQAVQEDEYVMNEVEGSISLYIKNPSKFQHNTGNQSRTNENCDDSMVNDHTIKQKFLSQVIRKAVFKEQIMSPQCERKILHEKARCMTELSEKKDFIEKNQSTVGLFENKQITELLADKQDYSAAKNKKQPLMNEDKILATQHNKIDQYLRFESRTEELRKNSRVEIGQRRFSKVTSVRIPSERQSNFRFEINSSSFLPAHRSSLAIQDVVRTQNSQIFESYDVYQYYRRLKTKSKKLLRFSMIKNQSDSKKQAKECSQNREVEDKSESKLKRSTERQAIKLPVIANGCGGKMEKMKSRVLSSKQKLVQSHRKQENTKNSAKNASDNFQKYSSKQPKQIKQRLRCYTQQQQEGNTQLDLPKNKILSTIVDIQKRDTPNHKSKQSQEESLNKNFIEKSLSSKIIQNFHERYYKKMEQEREGSKLSTLDMSENFILNWKESLDWESKKKLIVKKLGIKI